MTEPTQRIAAGVSPANSGEIRYVTGGRYGCAVHTPCIVPGLTLMMLKVRHFISPPKRKRAKVR